MSLGAYASEEYLLSPNQGVKNAGYSSWVIQKHEALTDAQEIRNLKVLIYLHKKPKDLCSASQQEGRTKKLPKPEVPY